MGMGGWAREFQGNFHEHFLLPGFAVVEGKGGGSRTFLLFDILKFDSSAVGEFRQNSSLQAACDAFISRTTGFMTS